MIATWWSDTVTSSRCTSAPTARPTSCRPGSSTNERPASGPAVTSQLTASDSDSRSSGSTPYSSKRSVSPETMPLSMIGTSRGTWSPERSRKSGWLASQLPSQKSLAAVEQVADRVVRLDLDPQVGGGHVAPAHPDQQLHPSIPTASRTVDRLAVGTANQTGRRPRHSRCRPTDCHQPADTRSADRCYPFVGCLTHPQLG